MTLALKIGAGFIAAAAVAAGTLVAGLALIATTVERRIEEAEAWDE